MEKTKEKVLARLNDLIEEAQALRTAIEDPEDPRFDVWKLQTEKLLDWLGGQKMIHEFRTSLSFPCSSLAGPAERLGNIKKKLGGGKVYLVVIKDDVEVLDKTDISRPISGERSKL